MIRKFKENDIDTIMQIWQNENVDKNTNEVEYTMIWNK